jgi:hypothetical protein
MPQPMSLTRRRFLQFLVSIAAVHVVAIAAYYLMGVGQRPERDQRIFAWVWMGATVAAVLIGLQRIKRARRAGGIRNRS